MIKKILDKQSNAENEMLNEAAAVNEVKLLLDGDAIEDLQLLQNAFPNSSNSKILSENADKERTKKLKELHNGDIYTLEEIKILCMKYRLRFLPSTYYKGSIPLELLRELKSKFSEENKLSHMGGNTTTFYERNLYIVAPSSMFNIKSYSETKREQLEEMKKLRRLDPACFAKIDENRYLFLKEWGNSFSAFRRGLGFFTAKHKTINRLFFASYLLFVAISVFILKAIGGLCTIEQDKQGQTNFDGWCLVFILSVAAAISISICWMSSSRMSAFLAYFKARDEGFFDTDKNLATENNWRKKD